MPGAGCRMAKLGSADTDFRGEPRRVPAYRIHRLKESAREQFRWAAHTIGVSIVRPKIMRLQTSGSKAIRPMRHGSRYRNGGSFASR